MKQNTKVLISFHGIWWPNSSTPYQTTNGPFMRKMWGAQTPLFIKTIGRFQTNKETQIRILHINYGLRYHMHSRLMQCLCQDCRKEIYNGKNLWE